MKAVIYQEFGDPSVLRVSEISVPEIDSKSFLVNIKYTSVTAADVKMRRANSPVARLFLGISKPRKNVLGTEFSGIVTQVGNEVSKVKKGDAIYGFTGFNLGAYAEFCVLTEKSSFASVPHDTTLKEAVCLADGATTAAHFLAIKASVKNGDKILVVGASGSIGTYALQIAKHFGAYVVGVCSGKNSDYIKKLGADEAIDYTSTDYHDGATKYDIIFDCIGNSTYRKCKRILSSRGKYLTTRGSLGDFLSMIILNRFRKRKIFAGFSINKAQELMFIDKYSNKKKWITLIDREYTLSEIVDAHAYVEKGHKRGNVVINI